MTANERLAEIKARAGAATEGPWEWGQGDLCHLGGFVAGPPIHYEAVWANRASDAKFIAHARTDVPALVSALEAVLAEHRPVHRVFSWSSGIRNEDPCPDCHGKAGVHDCGCWADEDITYSCATCRTDKGGGVDYPCPTVEAINEALGEDQ